MTRIYLMIDTVVGTSPRVVQALEGIEGITSAYRVTGPHDIIAIIEVADLRALGALLERGVRTLPDVTKTITCIVVPP